MTGLRIFPLFFVLSFFAVLGWILPAAGAGSVHAPSPPKADEPPLTMQAESFGVGLKTWREISESKPLLLSLEALPPEAKDLYRSLSRSDKSRINIQIHGETHVLFMTIDNKNAFIKGVVMGHDVFDSLQSRLDQDWVDDKITDAEFAKESHWVQVLSALTPGDRAALVSLLEIEIAAEAVPDDPAASRH